MNRLCYRVVYNKSRAMLMAVEESATSTGKGRQQGTRGAAAPMAGREAGAFEYRFALPAMQLAAWLCMGLTPAVYAQIVADPNAGANRPGVIQTANGLQQVNITRPSGAGVSTNAYSQFDVPRRGAILNNSPVIVATQQAGYVNGNPNLQPGSEARIIVNQVTSALPSQLRGYLEVAGQRAEVIVANPNGILVDGAGFINTSRATLTTGIPVFGGSGSLDAFRVTGGQITVQGAGLNASNVDQVDLIARAVTANAALYANRLNVIAGANQVDRATLAATPVAGAGPAPAAGIDVSQLGGMYANKILLASTELGVGVSTRGVLAAQAGELTLTSQGRLELAGQTNAAGAMLLAARDGIDNSGTTYGAQSVRVATSGALTNSGTTAAGQALTVTAGSVASTGTLGAGIRNDSSVDSQGDLAVSATGALAATGRNLAGGNAGLQGASVTLAGSQTQANGNLGLSASAGNLDLTGATTSAGAALRLNASGALVNDRGGLTAQGDTTIAAGSVSNRGGQIVSQDATAIQSAGTVNNAQGTMQSGGALTIGAASLDNTAGRAVSLNGDGLAITTSGDLTNAAGTTAAGTPGGVIGGNGNVTLQAGKLANRGAINAQGDAVIRAQALANDAGTLAAGRNLTATIAGDAGNRQGAMSGATVSLNAGSLDNAAGRIEGDGLGIDVAGTLSNRDGAIRQYGQSDTAIRAGGLLDNTGGTLAANGRNLDVSAGSLNNDGGKIQHAGSGNLKVTSQGGASNVSGAIQTNGGLTMEVGSLNNTDGNLSAPGTVELTVRGDLDSTNGAVRAGESLAVRADGALTNAGGRLESAGEHGSLSVTAASIDNTGGRIANAGDGLTRIAAQQALRNANQPGGATALIGGNGALSLAAGTLTNQGQISAKTDADLTAQALVNDGGSVVANGALTATVAGAVSNRQGTLSAQSLALTAGALDNAAGRIEADAMRLDVSGDLSNRGGVIRQFGQTSTTLHAGGLLDNTNGTVSANGEDLGVEAGSIANGGGEILHAGNGKMSLTSQGALGNAAGSILTNGQLVAQAASLENTAGRLSAGRDATMGATGDLLNRQGSVYGKDGLTLSAGGQLDNASGSAQTTTGDLSVSTGGALGNAGGTLSANGAAGKMTVSAATVDNAAGRIVNAGSGMTTVTAVTTVNNAGGTLGGNGDATVNALDLNNAAGGRIAAVGALTLNASNHVNNRGGTAYGGQGLSIGGPRTTLANDGGVLLGGKDVLLSVIGMTNGGGTVRANRDIGVGLPLAGSSLSGSGEMTAGGNLSLYLRGDYVNDAANRLRADGNMVVSTTGTLTNTATLAACGSLTAEGTNVLNAAGATMTGASATVKAAGTLTNAGRIDGDTVATNSAALANTGTIIGNRVTVQANDVANTGNSAIIAAAQDLKVYANNSVSNLDGATIYSAGNLQIARDGTRDPASGLLVNQVGSLVNSSAFIEADGNIDIAAGTVVNKRSNIVTEAGVPESVSQVLTLWQAGLPDNELYGHESISFPSWRWRGTQASISGDQVNALRSPITVEVPKTDVASLDTTAKTLSFSTVPVEEYANRYQPTCTDSNCPEWVPTLMRPLTANAKQYYQDIQDTGTTYKIMFWPDWDPAKHIRPDQVSVRYDLGVDYHDYNEVRRSVTTTTATDRLVSASDAARIQAAGNVRINASGGSITNYASTMAAGGVLDRQAAGGGVNDSGVVLQKTTTITGVSDYYWHQKSGGNSDLQTNVPISTTPVPAETVAALPSIQTGNQAVQTTAQNISVTSVNRVGETVTGSGVTGGNASGTTLAGASGEGGGATAVSASGAGRVNAADGKISRPQTLGTASGGIPNLRLPTNGLFTFRNAPEATYLVATDARFTQYKAFISSDYMLGALNLDPQKVQKRLGDGFYETKLIRDQVTQLTGRTFLAGYTDQLEEYKALMNNGVTYARAFGLTPGVGLSDEQMRQLTTDMVWMVSQEVTLPDGSRQTVLVPKVYLAQGNGVDLSKTGALVAGGSVSFVASGTLENSGRIVGDVATQVLGHDIVNRGTIGGDGSATVVQAKQDVRNLGGRITGQDVVVSAGRDVVNETQTISNLVKLGPNGYSAGATGVGSVASISATGTTTVLAGRDIDLRGSTIDAGKGALVAAGRDLNVGTVTLGTTRDTESRGGQSYSHDKTTINAGSAIRAGENVVAVAGRDATMTGSTIQAGGNASVVAGRDVTVTAAVDKHTHSEASLGGKGAEYKQSSLDETARGSVVQAGNNVTLAAGQGSTVDALLQSKGIQPAADVSGGKGNLAVLGSGVSTGGSAGGGGSAQLIATGDVTVGTVNETHDSQYWMESRRSGFMSKEKTTKESSEHQSVAVGSVVSADSIAGSAGRDLSIAGSTVAATNDVNLDAGRNLRITTAQSTSSSHSFEQTTKSGFGATGAGLSYGKRDQKDTFNDNAVTQTASLVGSTDGSVHLKAGSTLKVTGSELVAARDVTGVAADVTIEASKGTQHHDETHEIKQSGFTLGVSGGAIGSAISAGQKVGSATKSQDGRASALWGIAAGRDAYDAVTGAPDAVKSLADGKGPAGTAVTLSFGTSKSKQTLTQDGTSHTGSSVRAGGTATFIATGVDADGNKTAGNLDIVGSGVSAARVGLAAKGDVNIVSATDTNESHSTNKSSSGSIGVSYGAQGFGVSVSASAAKGNSDSTGATQVNSHVTGSESVSIVSGKNINVLGGVVSGGKVSADVGGNLNLASRQDTEESKARQQSMGGGLSFSQGGGLSGSFAASKGKADGSYANVTEQSGIRAGDGGFDINVKGNTDLRGAVIASTATEDKNKLKTGTLTWGDIENKADYSATSFGVSGGFSFGPKTVDKQTGQESGKNTGGVSPMIPQNESGSQRGLAQSGISGGTITITDTANQKQDVATLNRDTTNSNTTVGKNPDINNVLGKQADMMAAAQAAGEAVARTVGDIAASKEKEARKAFEKAERAYKEDPSDANRAAMTEAQAAVEGWKEGGEYRAALHAAGGAMIAGLGGGNALAGAVGAGAASLAAPKLEELGRAVAASVDTDNAGLNEALGNLAANIAAGGLGALVGGGSGAAMGANVDRFNRQLHPDERKWAKDRARAFAEYYKRETGQTISQEDAYQRLLSAGYANVDKYASDMGTSDQKAKQFIALNAPGNLFQKDNQWSDKSAWGNTDGSATPEQQARFGVRTPGEAASQAVTKAVDYLGRPCGANCGAKFDAIANAINALQSASVLYQDDPGSMVVINRQIEQLKAGITPEEVVRGATHSISDKDKAVAAMLLGTPFRVLAGATTTETLNAISLVQQIKDLRAALPSGLKREGNMAVATVEINGVPERIVAHSRIDNPTPTQAAQGIVGEGTGIFETFPVANKNGDMVPRHGDSEAKILENIALRLGDNHGAVGNIRILTERSACSSCLGVIEQFQKKYPDVKIDLIDNNGVVLRKPKIGG